MKWGIIYLCCHEGNKGDVEVILRQIWLQLAGTRSKGHCLGLTDFRPGNSDIGHDVGGLSDWKRGFRKKAIFGMKYKL